MNCNVRRFLLGVWTCALRGGHIYSGKKDWWNLGADPHLPNKWQVHHTLPQKYESIMKSAGINIHDIEYLKGIDPDIHPFITNEWMKWGRALDRTPSAEEIADFTKTIDAKYAKYWFN